MIRILFRSPTTAFVVLFLSLAASGCFGIRMRSWFVAVVNCFGAFVVLGICALDLTTTESGVWVQFVILIGVGLAEAVLDRYRGRLCVLFLKLFHKIYAPLTAGIPHPYRRDRAVTRDRIHELDKLYQSVTTALARLVTVVGLKVAG